MTLAPPDAAVIDADVRQALWAKLILNCAYNAVSAIAQRPYGENVQSPGITDVMGDVLDECLAVARAEGVMVQPDIRDVVFRLASTMPGQSSSTAQDLARGKPSEIDHLNGFIARRGAELGVNVPVNRTLHALVKLAEAARTGA